MEYLIEFGLFTGKSLIIVISLVIIILTIAAQAMKGQGEKDNLEVSHLNKKFEDLSQSLKESVLDKKDLKSELKKNKKKDKKGKKAKNKKKTVYVISFNGDIKASQADHLRKEVTAIINTAQAGDEVVANIESPGGMVHSYGLAAAQLDRIKKADLKLTVCVDKVAASGGYMMACTADQILAAPFAILGSVGVLAQIPNFNRVLKKHDIDYQEITAGEYKRTLTMFGEVTEKGKEKFTEQIESTHDLFKDFVKNNRPVVDISQVATGEYWYGQQALKLKLVDQLMTSDEYISNLIKDNYKVIGLKMKEKKKLGDKLSEAISLSFEKSLDKILTHTLKLKP